MYIDDFGVIVLYIIVSMLYIIVIHRYGFKLEPLDNPLAPTVQLLALLVLPCKHGWVYFVTDVKII